jgi:hypothetical protein
VEVQSTDILFPAHIPAKRPYREQIPAAPHVGVEVACTAPVEAAEAAVIVVVQRAVREAWHEAEVVLPLAAPGHTASHSRWPALALVQGIAVLRFPLFFSIYVNRCRVLFIGYYEHILYGKLYPTVSQEYHERLKTATNTFHSQGLPKVMLLSAIYRVKRGK